MKRLRLLGRVAGFEFRYQLTSPVFWGAAIVFFLLTVAAVASDTIRIGWGGQVVRNAPYAVVLTGMTMTLAGMFLMIAFVANVVLRDSETGFGPILRATPLPDSSYLFGRFVGGWAAGCVAFLSVPLGSLAALVVPGLDPQTIGPLHLGDYLYAYLLFCVPTLFVMGAIFFALATATRSILATYVAGLVALAAYFFLSLYLLRPEAPPAAGLIDPFAIGPLKSLVKHWTADDFNTTLPPLLGFVLEDRVIWGAIALLALAGAWFAFRKTGLVGRNDFRPARRAGAAEATPSAAPQAPMPAPTGRGGFAPLLTLTRFEISGLLVSPIFAALLGFAFLDTLLNAWLAGDDRVTVVWPVTRVMIQALNVDSAIPLFIAAFYAGELVWRDRERRIHEIVDATPAPDWSFLLPKILAVFTVLLAIGLIDIATAMLVQLAKGFPNLELGHYFTWFLGPWLLTMALYAVLSVFVQTLAPQKFVGLLLILIFYVAQLTAPSLGFEDHLYLYATTSPVPLSDMNGLGKFSGYANWFRAYWATGAVILGVIAYALWRRGPSAPLLVRLRRAPRRLQGPAGVLLGAAALAMAGLGGFIFYNTHVLNHYQTNIDSQRWAAAYEKAMAPLDGAPQPRITDVQLHVDLYPDRPKAVVRGHYVFQNKTAAPIKQLYVTWSRQEELHSFLGTTSYPDLKLTAMAVEGATLTRDDPYLHLRIYTFDQALGPGESRALTFETLREQRGFRNSLNEARIVDNGTFLENYTITPNLGFNHHVLLSDRAVRRRYGLPADIHTTPLEDPRARQFNYFRHDSDYVHSDITLTGPADQVLIAAGHKVSDEVVGGRRVARFQSEAPVLNFFSIQAARYAVVKDHFQDVAVEIFHHPPHTYNVARMDSVVKDALAYFTKNFGPYQFKQFRIVESPAYSAFAQSYPGTVAYSEASGFITRIDDRNGIDTISYVTAHELGHQWFAHQIIGGDSQGSTVLTETLAQYATMMVMEKRYGPAMVRRYLRQALDGYLSTRGKENEDEPALERVEEQASVRYEKGAVVMYLLRDRLGEEAVNRALRSLLHRFAFKAPPYPSSRDLQAALRAEAGPGEQQLITDLFQKITLYDVKAIDAKTHRRRDGRWDLDLTVEAHKRYADGKGRSAEAPLDEIFDLGAFTADPAGADFSQSNVIALQHQRVRTGLTTLHVTLDMKPSFAGIDPYTKYIDRDVSDNTVKVRPG